ncbi:hypothetical protein T229_06765 [Tannerella sp. oral taxon BU063 isolate Cell 5]|nr:hypothetical protein T229_06765 [Tannerella sp. oral taxon BU063 isolate Cell 5]ETK12732.1 hypothetical protein T235_07520 [Tannerella sp. oral taxon BU063 isolate Cell 8/11]
MSYSLLLFGLMICSVKKRIPAEALFNQPESLVVSQNVSGAKID